MMKRQQSQWKSSTGFILASAGSAIGLGAMWKFPYMAGDLWRRCLSSYVLNIHHFCWITITHYGIHCWENGTDVYNTNI